MPRLIKDGAIVEENAPELPSLERWLRQDDSSSSAVQLEPGESPAPLLDHLSRLELIAINFPAFMDGRGFSYGRELREHGYQGELRAVGHFIRDQLTYLQRCGFDAFQMAEESGLEEALASLNDFSEHYQASADKPTPLFRRRS